MTKKTKELIVFISKLFLFLRVSSLLFAWLGTKILPFKHSFPYAPGTLYSFGSPLLWSWANFDGVHYLRIIQDGYIYGLTQAYFPLYPLLTGFLDKLINNLLLSGLLISHLFFFGLLVVFYKLARLDFDKKIARRALILLVIFPTSFFFLSYYTESLFLFLVLLSFYLARKENWFWAGIVGIFASSARVLGVLIVPALLFEYWQKRKKQLNLKDLTSCFLPIFGILSYMVYLKEKFGDPLLFVHSQEGFGAGRSTDKIILLYRVFWRYLKMVLTVDPCNPIYPTVWLELAASVLFLILLILGIKKVRQAYLVFAGLAYLLPTLTGTFSSMPRYVLVLFPGFMVLGLIKSKRIFYFLCSIFFLLMGFCTVLFTRGHWIA